MSEREIDVAVLCKIIDGASAYTKPGPTGRIMVFKSTAQAEAVLDSVWFAEAVERAAEARVQDAWNVAAARRDEARRYYVAWQSASMRAAARRRAVLELIGNMPSLKGFISGRGLW